MQAGTQFPTLMQTITGRCDKALEPAIKATVNRKKLGNKLIKPDLSKDTTVNVG